MRNIRKIRLMRELTQVAVQIETGIDQSLISKYETGEADPPAQTLKLLAKFYDTTTDYLLDLTDKSER